MENYLQTKSCKLFEILLGVINSNIIDKTILISNEYHPLLSPSGFKLNIYTHRRAITHTGSYIEHIFIKKLQFNSTIQEAFVINSNVIDHHPVFLDISSDQKENEPVCMTKTAVANDIEKCEALISSNEKIFINNKFNYVKY